MCLVVRIKSCGIAQAFIDFYISFSEKNMQTRDSSKIYPCWRTYSADEKLPVVTFRNGRRIDLSLPEIKEMIDKMQDSDMLMFQEHLYYGRYQPISGQTNYVFGSNFSVTKNDDGSICVFSNGCQVE